MGYKFRARALAVAQRRAGAILFDPPIIPKVPSAQGFITTPLLQDALIHF